VDLDELLERQFGLATSGQLLAILSRRTMVSMLRTGELSLVWPGVYGRGEVDDQLRLRGLDLRAGEPVAVCLGTAAALHGFDTEDTRGLHILDPVGHHLRSSEGLYVHRREGAPLTSIGGRLVTEPDWTAIEVARVLRRPRALAALDAALRSGSCSSSQLWTAAEQQAGRRGIVVVRELIDVANGLAESAMESEARLVMMDGGLPGPVLQYEIVDRHGRLWRLDFAWPEARLAVEYDGVDWHSDPDALRRDRQKRAALTEMGWMLISIVADDVRRTPDLTVGQIESALDRRAA
jgi:hypothetical protein